MSETVRLFKPDPEILAHGINAYIERQALRCHTGEISEDHRTNQTRALRRFRDAWAVSWAWVGGPHFLVPAYEDRRVKLAYGANGEAEAVHQAHALAKILGIALPTEAPTCVRNGQRRLEDCEAADLDRWQIANPQWHSGHTQAQNLTAVCDCFAWWADERGVKAPFRRRRLPKFLRPRRRPAQRLEYIRLMRKGSRVLRRWLWASYHVQGIRTCEQRELLWSDFDWENGMIVLADHKTVAMTGKPRRIPLTPWQLRFFQRLHKLSPASTSNETCKECGHAARKHVFLNTYGVPWTRRSLGLHFRRTAQRIGLDEDGKSNVSPYCFRHAFATEAQKGRIANQTIGKLMGHEGEQMVEGIYGHADQDPGYLRELAQETEAARRRARKPAKPKPPKIDPPMPLFDGLD